MIFYNSLKLYLIEMSINTLDKNVNYISIIIKYCKYVLKSDLLYTLKK